MTSVDPKLILALARSEFFRIFGSRSKFFFWMSVTPLVLVSIYHFVFSNLLHYSTKSNKAFGDWFFPLFLFVGIYLFTQFMDVFGRSVHGIDSYRFLIKKTNFNISNLPFVFVYIALVSALPFIMVFAVAVVYLYEGSNLLPLFLMMIDLCITLYMISALMLVTGFLFDSIKHLLPAIALVLMYVTPIFYAVADIPENYRALILSLPLATTIELARAALFDSEFVFYHELIFKLAGYTCLALVSSMMLNSVKKVAVNVS